METLQLPDISGAELLEFVSEPGWPELDRFWRWALAVAVEQGASSVHYHPWRAEGHLYYLVAGVRYDMVHPHPRLARRVAAVAGALVSGSRVGAAARRWLGWPVRASGRVRMAGASGSAVWLGVVWSVGGFIGVEWCRFDPPTQEAEPGAAPDTAI